MSHGTDAKVVDFNTMREQKLGEKRRKNERILFRNLLGAYCVIDQDRLKPVEILDISEDGCAFQVPFDPKTPWPANNGPVTIRLYFTQDTYLPVQFLIVNSRSLIEQGAKYQRFGCQADRELSSYPAFRSFVHFLKLYSELSHRDTGSATLFYL